MRLLQRPPTPRLPVSKTVHAMPHCRKWRAAARPLTPPPIMPTRMVFFYFASVAEQRCSAAYVLLPAMRNEHLCVDCTALTLSTASVVVCLWRRSDARSCALVSARSPMSAVQCLLQALVRFCRLNSLALRSGCLLASVLRPLAAWCRANLEQKA